MLIDELLVVCNDGLGDGLTDGVDLGGVSTTSNSDTDIDTGELVKTDDQDGLVDLESQDLGLDEVEGLSVDLDESLSSLFPSCQYFLSHLRLVLYCRIVRTLQWATAVAIHILSALPHQSRFDSQSGSIPVFFLPKHCTLWVVDAMIAFGVGCFR